MMVATTFYIVKDDDSFSLQNVGLCQLILMKT